MIETLSNVIETRRDFLVDVRRYLHKNPELSGAEKKTTRYLAGLLEQEGFRYSLGPEERGVIVDLGEPAATKRVALRADIDDDASFFRA